MASDPRVEDTDAALEIRRRVASGRPDGPVCVIVCHNELERLAGFFSFYRGIGVEEFWFVDNGSDDGTAEFLAEQPDVNLVHTTASYGSNRKGLRWSRAICDRFLHDRWVLIVDVDELFVWPGFGTVPLSDFMTYMDVYRYRLAPTVMMDFFPLPDNWRTFDGQEFLSVAPLCDVAGYSVGPARHFPFYQVRGGLRQRMFSGEGQGPILQKMPLVKWRRGEYFLKSTHYYSAAAPLCDCLSSLAHFKFSASSKDKFELEIGRGQRWGGGQQYASYRAALDAFEAFYEFEDIARIDTYEDLHAFGVLKASNRYKRFLEANGRADEEAEAIGRTMRPISARHLVRNWTTVTRANAPHYEPTPDFAYTLDGVTLDGEQVETYEPDRIPAAYDRGPRCGFRFLAVRDGAIYGLLLEGTSVSEVAVEDADGTLIAARIAPCEVPSDRRDLAVPDIRIECPQAAAGTTVRIVDRGNEGAHVDVTLPRRGASLADLGFDGVCEPNEYGRLRGWAWQPDVPQRHVRLAVYVDGLLWRVIDANRYRADLARAGKGSGRYGFSTILPQTLRRSGRRHRVEVRIAENGAELRRTPLTLEGYDVVVRKKTWLTRFGF